MTGQPVSCCRSQLLCRVICIEANVAILGSSDASLQDCMLSWHEMLLLLGLQETGPALREGFDSRPR